MKDILEKGLVPNRSTGTFPAMFKKKGVYLSEVPFQWMHWVTNESRYAGAMIKIDVTGLEVIKSIGITHDDKEIPEFICPVQIPVERFICVSVSTDEKPCFFEELKEDVVCLENCGK